MGLILRPITTDDTDFLYQVYASTRVEEFAFLNWTAAQLRAFLHMQFTAQHTYYQEQFADGDFQIVMLDNQPIGRLYTQRRDAELSLIDIALLPEFRRRGIGSALLHDVMACAAKENLPVRLYVELNNPAQHLYQRFGFYKIGENGVYFHMEAMPTSKTNNLDVKSVAQDKGHHAR